ncbi:hypothetical protein AS593_06820 [Caulobacter vibrioides]|nr:hypothetical protein AS593_06820 [Caulobacter vibrioides]
MSLFRSARITALAACASLTLALLAQAAAAAAKPHAPSPVEAAKRVACEKVWAAQKVRHGARAAFVAACVAKG